MESPNILLLFTDDQRFDTIKALGNEQIKTPNLDRLVASGTTFEHAHIMGGTDVAVCMPSRAMLLTGRTLFHLAESGKYIPEDQVLLGEALQAAGYYCWGAGKWHNGHESYARSFNDGADVYFGGMYDHWNVPVHEFDPSGKYDGRITKTAYFRPSNEIEEKIATHVNSGRHSSELFAEQASSFIESYTGSQPFFAYVAFMAPHDPRTMPQEFLDLYNPDDIQIPSNFMENHPFDNGQLTVRDELLSSIPRRTDEIKQHIAEYYAMISHIDAEVGKIILSLEKSGKLDNTMIVFAGDNGLALGRHGLMGKQNLYDHSIHVPLIISGPGVPKSKISTYPTYTVDVYPTICELAGAEIPKTVLGRSLVAEIRGDPMPRRDYLYFAYRDLMRSVQADQWKLIEYSLGNVRHSQLFNIETDPMETDDLSCSNDHRDILADLRRKLVEARQEFGDDIAPFNSFWDGF